MKIYLENFLGFGRMHGNKKNFICFICFFKREINLKVLIFFLNFFEVVQKYSRENRVF
jgi:hypothetical protein